MKFGFTYDKESLYSFTDKYEDKPLFYLPHSCDEWLIGDVKAMEYFLKEGSALLAKVKAQQAEVGDAADPEST